VLPHPGTWQSNSPVSARNGYNSGLFNRAVSGIWSGFLNFRMH